MSGAKAPWVILSCLLCWTSSAGSFDHHHHQPVRWVDPLRQLQDRWNGGLEIAGAPPACREQAASDTGISDCRRILGLRGGGAPRGAGPGEDAADDTKHVDGVQVEDLDASGDADAAGSSRRKTRAGALPSPARVMPKRGAKTGKSMADDGVLLSSDPDFDGTLAMDDGEGVPTRRRGRRRGGVQEGVERVPRERQMDWWQRLEAGLGETADASEAEDDGAELDEAAERRRRRIKEWGEPRKCPPPLDRTFTFEEDMAVIKQAEEALRRACDQGDTERAAQLLRCGATYEQWVECTQTCVDTLVAAQREVWREQRREERTEVSSSSTSTQDLPEQVQEQLALLREVDGFKPPKHDRSSASFSATVYEDADVAGAVGHRTRVVVRDYKRMKEADSDPSESSREEVFLQGQVTLETRKKMLWQEGGTSWENRKLKEELAEVRAQFPRLKCIQPRRGPPVGTFFPGEEDREEEEEERRAHAREFNEFAELPEMEDFVSPIGRRMHRIEMALARNESDELDTSDREHAEVLTNPAEALQDLMSESSTEFEGELLKIRKATTEITQAELNPWDRNADGRLSATFGAKEFDVVDTLRGFERAGRGTGVRTGDQTYNQIRSRFLNAKGGSYKRKTR